jgi:hypothetical protein
MHVLPTQAFDSFPHCVVALHLQVDDRQYGFGWLHTGPPVPQWHELFSHRSVTDGTHVRSAPQPHAPPKQVGFGWLHETGVPWHLPDRHWSPVVQRLLSLHVVPLGAGTCVHCVTESHPSVVHTSLSSQFTVPDPMHAPASQWSPVVHTLESEHVGLA